MINQDNDLWQCFSSNSGPVPGAPLEPSSAPNPSDLTGSTQLSSIPQLLDQKLRVATSFQHWAQRNPRTNANRPSSDSRQSSFKGAKVCAVSVCCKLNVWHDWMNKHINWMTVKKLTHSLEYQFTLLLVELCFCGWGGGSRLGRCGPSLQSLSLSKLSLWGANIKQLNPVRKLKD